MLIEDKPEDFCGIKKLIDEFLLCCEEKLESDTYLKDDTSSHLLDIKDLIMGYLAKPLLKTTSNQDLDFAK